MKFICIALVLFLFFSSSYAQNKESKNGTKNNFLKKSRRTNEQFFLFDGEKYSQEQVDLKAYIGNCFIRYNSTIYDLNKLSTFGSFFFKTKDGKSVQFDVCKNVVAQCDNKLKGLVVSTKDNKPCKKFAGGWNEDKMWSWENSGTDKTQITLEFPKGDVCNEKTGERYSVTMKIQCDSEQTTLKPLNDGSFDTNKCNNTILASSIEACPKYTFFSWWNRTPMNKYWLAGILFILGGLFLLIGNKFFDWVVAIIIAAAGAVIIKTLVAPFYVLNLYLSLALGVCLAILCHFVYVLIPYILGAFLGFFAGSFLYTIVLVWFPTINPNYIYYGSIFVCILVAILILHYIVEVINIIISSVIGAYLAVRGASIFLKGFPDETYTSELVEHFEFGQLKILFGGRVVVYIIAMIALAIVGIIVQLGIKSTSNAGEQSQSQEKPPVENTTNANPTGTN